MNESDWVTREELVKVHNRRKINIITNIILIVVILTISIYVIYNIESIKTLEGNVCKICELKTGAKCLVQKYLP